MHFIRNPTVAKSTADERTPEKSALEIDKQKLKCILLTARDLNITSYF
jgi:hypothetical protein